MKLSALSLTALSLAVMSAAAPSFAAPAPSTSPAPAASATAPATADAIDAFVAGVMSRMHVPGVAIAVVRAGKLEKIATYGVANLEWQAPVTADTAFQLASTTKIFTATVLMQLVAEGKLALESPLSRYLPDLPAAWRDVTIAHLASHTSGLPSLGPADPKVTTLGEAYALLRDKPMAYPTGERASYGGGGFLVLTHILEKVSGQSFPALVESKIVKPLGLTCTSFEEATEQGGRRVAKVLPRRGSVYIRENGQQRLQWFLYPMHMYSQGGAFSCVSDLAKWAIAMDQGTLVSTANQARAATPPKLTSGKDADFGVVFTVGTQRGARRHGHSGGPALAEVLRLPEHKLTIIALTNQQQLNPVLAGSIAGLLLPAAREVAVRDGKPEWTRRLRAVVASLSTGAVDAQGLAPSVRERLGQSLREWGPVMAGTWAPLDRWTLVEERTEKPAARGDQPVVRPSQDHAAPSATSAKLIRVYRGHHGPIAVRWRFTLDEAGLLINVEAFPD